MRCEDNRKTRLYVSRPSVKLVAWVLEKLGEADGFTLAEEKLFKFCLDIILGEGALMKGRSEPGY